MKGLLIVVGALLRETSLKEDSFEYLFGSFPVCVFLDCHHNMKFHPFSASAWTAVVSVLLAGSSSASDHDGGFVSLPLAGRSRSPLSLGEAWARVAQVKLKQYRAIQNFKANTGDYPADVNLTTLQRLTDGISPTAAIHKATMKIEMAGLAGKRADVATIELEDQKQASFWTGPQSYGSPKQGPFVLDHDTGKYCR